jgi:hypothetical protein
VQAQSAKLIARNTRLHRLANWRDPVIARKRVSPRRSCTSVPSGQGKILSKCVCLALGDGFKKIDASMRRR